MAVEIFIWTACAVITLFIIGCIVAYARPCFYHGADYGQIDYIPAPLGMGMWMAPVVGIYPGMGVYPGIGMQGGAYPYGYYPNVPATYPPTSGSPRMTQSTQIQTSQAQESNLPIKSQSVPRFSTVHGTA